MRVAVLMPGFIRPALAYFAAVFAGAFALGVLRVIVILPLTGPLFDNTYAYIRENY